MANKDLNIIITAKDKASKEFKTIQKNMSSFWSKFKEVWKQFAIIWTAIAWTTLIVWKQFLDLWTNIEQTLWKAQTVFWEYFDVIDKVAKETATSMWLSRTEYLKSAAGLQDLLIPMWFAREEATKMTTETLSLSGALSEWSAWQYNAEQVSQILAKAMLWEREQLKTLGIAISEADVQQRLLENWTIELTWAALQQEKAIATQQLIFEKSTDAQKAFENWQGSLARQQAELTATIQNTKEVIATALIPVFHELATEFIPLITTLSENIQLWASNTENIEKVKTSINSLITVITFVVETIKFLVNVLYTIWETLWNIAFDIYTFSQTMINIFKNIAEIVSNLWTWLWEWVKTIMSLAVDWLYDKFEWLKTFIEWIIGFATGAFDKVKKIWENAKSIASSIGSWISSAVWWVTDLVSWARELGWPVRANQTYLVWERWPELFTPASSGRINNQSWWGWWITINMWWVTVNNEADENRLIEKMKKALIRDTQLFNNWIA